MYQRVNAEDLRQQLISKERGDHFSYRGLNALVGYLESYEEETGEQIEADVVALCIDWTEYKTAQEAADDIAGGPVDGDPEQYIMSHGVLIPFEGGVLVGDL
jgi:hypothetical protein